MVTTSDRHPHDPEWQANDNPHSLETEQALLGTVLFDNDAIDMISAELTDQHFYEPFHGRMWKRILKDHTAGRKCDFQILYQHLRADPAVKELGGLHYLADLVDRAPPASMVDTYAQAVHDAATARQLVELANAIGRYSRRGLDDDSEPVSSAKIIDMVETAVFQMRHADPRLQLSSTLEGAGQVMQAMQDRSTPVGVNVGIPRLADAVGPLLAKELILLPGRPSMGKSVLGCHLALRAAAPAWWAERCETMDAGLPPIHHRPVGTLEINGEMSVAQMSARHLSDIGFELFGGKYGNFPGFPSFEDIRERKVDDVQLRMMEEAADVFGQFPIKMLKRSGLRVSQLRSIAKRQAAVWDKQGIEFGLLVVDHVGLLKPEGRVSGRYEAQTEIAESLQQLADDLNVPIVALVQLNREVEKRDNKRPQLSDLRDAGAWEECADIVMFPFREAYYALRQKEPQGGAMDAEWQEWDRARKSKALEIIIAKKRGGRTRDVTLWCEVSHNAVRDEDPVAPRRNML